MLKRKYQLLAYSLTLFCCGSHASAWAYLANTPSGNKAYAMTAGGTELFPIVWFKTTSPRGLTLTISKDVINCAKGEYAIKQASRYNEKGIVIDDDNYTFEHWHKIIPDSLAAYEYTFACHRELF